MHKSFERAGLLWCYTGYTQLGFRFGGGSAEQCARSQEFDHVQNFQKQFGFPSLETTALWAPSFVLRWWGVSLYFDTSLLPQWICWAPCVLSVQRGLSKLFGLTDAVIFCDTVCSVPLGIADRKITASLAVLHFADTLRNEPYRTSIPDILVVKGDTPLMAACTFNGDPKARGPPLAL